MKRINDELIKCTNIFISNLDDESPLKMNIGVDYGVITNLIRFELNEIANEIYTQTKLLNFKNETYGN